jgi:hypothetical protein
MLALLTQTTANAQPKPAFVYESMLDTFFHPESGTIRFDAYDLAFAPEPPLGAEVVITDEAGTILTRFPFRPDYRFTQGVFARAQVQGPAEFTLTKPGVYNIIFLIDGQPASRLPVVLEETSTGDDPFNPSKSYRFFGLWHVFAHLTMKNAKEKPYPVLTFWVGSRDLKPGTDKDTLTITLKRDGEPVAHSLRNKGHIASGHYKRTEHTLYHPHEERESHLAEIFMLEDWTKDGAYELIVTRTSDNTTIRNFLYTAKDGNIEHLPDTKLGFEPHIDYVVPRVVTKNVNLYGFSEAIWLRSR